MGINWTTVMSSGLVAAIICVFNTISNRYTARMLDHIEKLLGNGKKDEKSK
jgi:hypothetical protein